MSTYGYLQHHGIKGQRWGIRRYQNPDGSLTPEGRARYGYNSLNSSKQNQENLKRGIKDKIYTTSGTLTRFYKDDEEVKNNIDRLYKQKSEAKWDEFNVKKEALFKDDAHTFFNSLKNTKPERVEQIIKEYNSDDEKAVYFETVWEAEKYALAEEILKDPEIEKWVNKALESQKKYNSDLNNYVKDLVNILGDSVSDDIFKGKGNAIYNTRWDIEHDLMPKVIDDLSLGYYTYLPGKQNEKISYVGNIIDNEMYSRLPGNRTEWRFLNDKASKSVEDALNDYYWKMEDYLKDKGYIIYD